MIRALITLKAANLNDAIALAQQAPFHVPAEKAVDLFVPANEERSEDGLTVITPATLFWASGEFSEAHFEAMSTQADGLDWASVDTYNLLTDPDFPSTKLAELEGQTLFAAPKR
jgi:hypothetical protein